MCHQGHQSCIPEPNPKTDQSAMELVGHQTSRKEMQCLPQCVSPTEVPRVPLLWGIKKEKGYTGYTLLPTGLGTEADLLH